MKIRASPVYYQLRLVWSNVLREWVIAEERIHENYKRSHNRLRKKRI
jgi:hypothetical protein